jgi:hypothetical protein
MDFLWMLFCVFVAIAAVCGVMGLLSAKHDTKPPRRMKTDWWESEFPTDEPDGRE